MQELSNQSKSGPKGVYTPLLIPQIVERAKMGMPQTLIARGIGIRPETFSRWLNEHPELKEAMEEAKIAGVVERLNKINNAKDKFGNPVWQAQAWVLQRMFPAEFAQPDTKVEVRNETSVTVNVITPERLKQLQERRMQGLREAGLVHGAN